MAWTDPEPRELGQVVIRDMAFRVAGILVVVQQAGRLLDVVAYFEARA